MVMDASGARVVSVLDGPTEIEGSVLRVVRLADGTMRVEARSHSGWEPDVGEFFQPFVFARPRP